MFVCEYCNEDLVTVEDPFYTRDWELLQKAYCDTCGIEFDFIFSLRDIEENEYEE